MNTKAIKPIISAIALALTASAGFAKPAMKGFRTYRQPDGSVIKVRVVGDENLHFTVSEEGLLLKLDKDGFYRLGAIASDGAVVSSGVSVSEQSAVTGAVKLDDDVIATVVAKRNTKRLAPQSGLGLSSSAYPTQGSPKGLIILVEFSDVRFNSSYDAGNYFQEMINGENFTQFGGTGSAIKYFTEQSGGKFTPDFDVMGPVTLPRSQKFYGENDRYGDDANAHLMVTHAVDILDNSVDFSVYDTDGDGVIDNVFVFYAGQGEADYGSEDCVWPHSWDVRYGGEYKTVDGVQVGHYACSNEWDEFTPCGVGTFIHEFSHVMGLPDLYSTSDSSARYTPDSYSVLDYGPYNNDGRTPPNYGAYEKNALGWYEPLMIDREMSVSLPEISSGQFGLIPTENEREFFLLENRQLTGWDKFIPNHGMLVWHIDYYQPEFENNSVNNNKRHQYVDIVEANNIQDFAYAEGYTFPGNTRNTALTASTTPALKSWSGRSIDLPITDIRELEGVIMFDVAGGDASSLVAPKPFVNEFSEKDMYFVAEWTPVEGATEYFISVYGAGSGESGEVQTGFDGSKLSDGWSASSADWYTTNSNYGVSSPSYKFSKDGQYLLSPVTGGDVKNLEFWAKGQSSSGTSLIIEGLANGQWVSIANYTPVSNKIENVVIDDIPQNVRQIRFSMSKSQGNIAIDDIVIRFDGGMELLPDYDNLSVGNVTSYKIDRLVPDVKTYQFTVKATDGNKFKSSNPVLVTLAGEGVPSGVGSVYSESETLYFNLQGIMIVHPEKGQIVIERRGNSARKIIFQE